MAKSKKNGLAGTKKGKSKSAIRLQNSAEARKKKKIYDTVYSATPERKKYRAALNKNNKKNGTYGNNDGIDASHTKSGKLVKEKQSKNRARNGKNGKSSKK